jgi:hypothetical protein
MMLLRGNSQSLWQRLTVVFIITAVMSLVAVSCAPKQPILISDKSQVLEEVSSRNSQSCDYKGRISVFYNDTYEDLRFRALLDKKCEDSFDLKILGAFSGVLYDISYRNGEVKAYEKGIDDSNRIGLFMRNRGLDTMITGLKFPYALPDSSYMMLIETDGYRFVKGRNVIHVNRDMMVSRIYTEKVVYEYGYSGRRINSIKLNDGNRRLEIGLQP